MGNRRKGREAALQILCLLDMQPDLTTDGGIVFYYQFLLSPDRDADEPEATADEGESGRTPSDAAAESTEMRRFAESLVLGVRGSLGEIDSLLGQSSRNWRLERMNWVDRNLLRLSAHELRACPDVPAKVAINEAIELAKRFGTAESSAFINGVLDRVMEEIGRR